MGYLCTIIRIVVPNSLPHICEICTKVLGVDQRFSTAYHPESQGQVESNNKWLETYLRIFSAYRQDDWADFLHTAEFAYNNHHHPSIEMTPFYANYGYHPVYTNRASPDQSWNFPYGYSRSTRYRPAVNLPLRKHSKPTNAMQTVDDVTSPL
jgi:hypothetical protein